MPRRTYIWQFQDATERDAHGPAQGVTESDIAVLADGTVWVYDNGAWVGAGGGGGGNPDLATVLATGANTGGTSITMDPGDGLETKASIGVNPSNTTVSVKHYSVLHTPAGAGFVDIGPPLFVPQNLSLPAFRGWMRIAGTMVWEDGGGTTLGDYFAIEGEVGFGGIDSPVIMAGKMRTAPPGATDYGAMWVDFQFSTGVLLRARDWNDSFQRLYTYRVELAAYDGASP